MAGPGKAFCQNGFGDYSYSDRGATLLKAYVCLEGSPFDLSY